MLGMLGPGGLHVESTSVGDSQTTSGLDLFLELPPGPGRRAALERALHDAIRSGRLSPGAPLPSSRALSRDLGVARATVTEAYAQLAAAGYLATRQGAGTWVARGAGQEDGADPDEDRPGAPRFDLRPGLPDLTSFPRAAWLRALRAALGLATPDVLAAGDPRGRPELRLALRSYLARARGVQTSSSRLLVCNGVSQGLKLVCDVLRARGARRVAVEDPSLFLFPPIVRAASLEVVPVPVDEAGIQADRLFELDADAVLVTPAHQFPLGATLEPERRSALLRWAVERDAYVIEDDYDGEFRYDRKPVGAVQGVDPSRVIYAGTASKTLAPGVRLAWLAFPPSLVEPATRLRDVADRSAPALDQLALAELLASGEFDRHVRRMRLRYRARRDRLASALAEVAPGLALRGIAAGLHAILELPDDLPEERVLALAEERSVGLTGLGRFRHGAYRGPQALVIGYATPPEHGFPGALRALRSLLAALWNPGRGLRR
jgi:GntR family transcriptional regulator / MocR family aminotransferase